jgi:hypothetical protein
MKAMTITTTIQRMIGGIARYIMISIGSIISKRLRTKSNAKPAVRKSIKELPNIFSHITIPPLFNEEKSRSSPPALRGALRCNSFFY